MITFHRVGAYAAYFGLDTDNQWAVGGWSAGAARQIIALDTNTLTMTNKTLNSSLLGGTSTIAEGVVWNGWVRMTGAQGIYNNTYGVGIFFNDTVAPRIYGGSFSGEYVQSRLWRHETGGNVTLNYLTTDMGLINTGTQITLPDLNLVYGRIYWVKNITGSNFNVYVTNGNGIYTSTWLNPMVLGPGDSITVFASNGYVGWMVI